MNNTKYNRATMLLLLLVLASTPIHGKDKNPNVAADFERSRSKDSVLKDSVQYYGHLYDIARMKSEISQQAYFERQYSQYFTNSLKHRQQTFDWQLYSSKLIFLTVIIIVLCGLVFSGLQFYQSLKQTSLLTKIITPEVRQSIENKAEKEKSEIELSLSGLKINSSVIGLIILTLSVAFFYLYILYVYPITQLKLDNANFTKNDTTVVGKH